MPLFNFTLVLDGPPLDEELLDRLFESGCDDASFGVRGGFSVADFDREAPNFATALISAILDAESVDGLRVLRVEPDDFVTAATIAERTGRSRESIRLLAKGERGPGGFPQPVSWLDGKQNVWQWSAVSEWFAEHENEEVAPGGGAPEVVAALNGVLDTRRNLATLTDLATTTEDAALAFDKAALRALPAMVDEPPQEVRRRLSAV